MHCKGDPKGIWLLGHWKERDHIMYISEWDGTFLW